MSGSLSMPAVVIALGSAGMGLTWGWLVGLFRWRRVASVAALALATLAMVAQVVWLAGWFSAVVAAGAAIAAATCHLLWKRRLAHRYSPPVREAL